MDNFVQPGDYVELTAPVGGVVTGVPKTIGALVVVPCVTAAAGEKFNAAITGVFDVTKIGSQAWAEGALVYWDEANDRATTSSVGNTLMGHAVKTVGSGAGETTGRVRLNAVGGASGT